MNENIIIGRNSVQEALRAGRALDKLYVRQGEPDAALGRIIAAARALRIPIAETDKRRLDTMAEGGNHQGVVALGRLYEYVSVEDMLVYAAERGEAPFIVLCDKVCDPHNLGAMIRTANAAGAHGVVITKHEGVGVTAVVDKASAGAVSHTKIARVTSLAKTIDVLKANGVWVTGADGSGEKTLFEADFSGAVAIVVGSEGEGISRLVREKCDFLVSIPMRGAITSLNASVAAALFMYEVARKR
ncbi:MAG: 23S rRNA (guanosine(2251)-2'-O)-methyltransferase RlmB [Clostridia bacterium]|nr:23S rRNA (guanosine(2251)-2'-O)-methyltransferase RlmB [Clostridia bacterium]